MVDVVEEDEGKNILKIVGTSPLDDDSPKLLLRGVVVVIVVDVVVVVVVVALVATCGVVAVDEFGGGKNNFMSEFLSLGEVGAL